MKFKLLAFVFVYNKKSLSSGINSVMDIDSERSE